MTQALLLLTLLSWGIAGLFDKKALECGSPISIFLAFHLFNWLAVPILLLLLPMVYGTWQLSSGVFLFEGLNAIAALLAYLTYFYAMKRTQASFILGITAGYPILSQLLAVPILGEQLSIGRLLASILVTAGVILIGYSSGEERKNLDKRSWLAVLACITISTLMWALLGIFEKQALNFGRPLEAYLSLSICKSLLVVAALIYAKPAKVPLKDLKSGMVWRFSWSSAALVAVGNIAYIFALAERPASLVIVATAGYPLIMYIGAIAVLKEKVNVVRILGIIAIVASSVVVELL